MGYSDLGSGVRVLRSTSVEGGSLRCELPASPLRVQAPAKGDEREKESLMGALRGYNPKANTMSWMPP